RALFFKNLHESFGKEISRFLFGADQLDGSAEILDLFRAFYDQEQKISSSIGKARRRHWMYRALAEDQHARWLSSGRNLKARFDKVLRDCADRQGWSQSMVQAV